MTKQEFQKRRTKIISDLLDNIDENGIYPTGECFKQLDSLFYEANKINFNRVNELVQQYMKEKLPNRNKPFHYEAEIAAGMNHFIDWLNEKQK